MIKKFLFLFLLLLFFLPLTIFGQFVITQQNQVVVVNTPFTFTSTGGTGTVTWSLASNSVGSINSSTGVYTPPTTTIPKNQNNGCMIRGDSDVYNIDISGMPLDPNSTTMMNQLSGAMQTYPVQFSAYETANIATNSTPTNSNVFLYTPLNNSSGWMQVPYPDVFLESGYYTSYTVNTDRHYIVQNINTCLFQEMYNQYPVGFNVGCPLCTAQSGTYWHGTDYYLNPISIIGGTSTAAGTLIEPTTIKFAELLAGVIPHRLSMTLGKNLICGTASCPGGTDHRWPATSTGFDFGLIPYGAVLRMHSSKDCSTYDTVTQMICVASKKYGMMITDVGLSGIGDVNFDVDANAFPGVIQHIYTGSIKLGDFDVIDESSLEISANNGIVNPNNGIVNPVNSIRIIATDSATPTPNVTTSDAILKGVTLGVGFTDVNNGDVLFNPSWLITCDTPSITFTAIVNGASNQSVTSSMSPSLGTLSGLTYTPPACASIATATLTTITFTSVADSNATYKMQITTIPGQFTRVNVGGCNTKGGAVENTNFTDANGNTYYTDCGTIGPLGFLHMTVYQDYLDPANSGWPNVGVNKDIPVWYHYRLSTFGEQTYFILTSNSAYTVVLDMGSCLNEGPTDSFMQIDANGSQIGTFQMHAAVGQPNQCKPLQYEFTTTVTNNIMKFGVYATNLSNGVTGNSYLSGFVMNQGLPSSGKQIGGKNNSISGGVVIQ